MSMEPCNKAPQLPEAGRIQDRGADRGPAAQPQASSPGEGHRALTTPRWRALQRRPSHIRGHGRLQGPQMGWRCLESPPSLYLTGRASGRGSASGEVFKGNGPSRFPRRWQGQAAGEALAPSGRCRLPAMPTSQPHPQLLPPTLTCLVSGSCQAWRGRAGDGCREPTFPWSWNGALTLPTSRGSAPPAGQEGEAATPTGEGRGRACSGCPALARAGAEAGASGPGLDRLRDTLCVGWGLGPIFVPTVPALREGLSAGPACGAAGAAGSQAHTWPLSAQRPLPVQLTVSGHMARPYSA